MLAKFKFKTIKEDGIERTTYDLGLAELVLFFDSFVFQRWHAGLIHFFNHAININHE